MARQAREYARAPYSHFKVSAVVECADGRTFTGCNVENSNYGSTLCAEQVALTKAVSEGARDFIRIAVIADARAPVPPCGACRQVIIELCVPEADVVMAHLGGAPEDLTLESKTVARVQQTPSSQYDPALPGRPIGGWLNQIVGPQSGVSWRLGECIGQGAA